MNMILRLVVLFLWFGLAACDKQSEIADRKSGPLTVTQVLSTDDVQGYARAIQPRLFSFPGDHGLHEGFRNEWWYFTGNVFTESGRRFGFQVTVFYILLTPEQSNAVTTSHWAGSRIWMGHVALSDMKQRRHIAAEIFSRENPNLAGVSSDPFRLWLQDWQVASEGTDFPWTITIPESEFTLSLQLTPTKSPVLQGRDGLSQKSTDPGNASYYYSIPRLQTSGTITTAEGEFRVTGTGWLDREWGTSALGKDQSGWDWFALQFNNGTEIMYYQLRDNQGRVHSHSHGSFTNEQALKKSITTDDIDLKELKNWSAPSGTEYTTEWLMRYGDNDWIIRALFDDQFMALSFYYWEGAVDVIDAMTGEKVGWGYLEMVR